MKKLLKRSAIILLACLGVMASFCAGCLARSYIIAGKWSDPDVRVAVVTQSETADGTAALVHYGYGIAQTAVLKYPYYSMKGTAWEHRIDSSYNLIVQGRGLAVFDVPTGRLFFLSITEAPVAIMRASSHWVLFTPNNVYRVTPTDTTVLFSGATNGAIANFTCSPGSNEVLFCACRDWDVRCFSMDLESGTAKELYSFTTLGQGSPRQMVRLGKDREHAVFIYEAGHRAESGILAIGIKESDSSPIRILQPESMVPGATSYGWDISADQRRLFLTFSEADPVWVLDLETLTTSRSENGGVKDELPVGESQDPTLLPGLMESLTKHVRTSFLKTPDRRNFYEPVEKK
jgi:hypothetical protein